MQENLKNMLIPTMNNTNKVVQLVMEQRMQASKLDLTIKQVILLHRVNEKERQQSELAMITNRDKGSLTRLIQSLERKDFVKRRVCESDSRKSLVKITKKGGRALEKATAVVRQAFKDLTINLTEKEKMVFIKTSKKLNSRALELIDAQIKAK